MTDQSRTNLRNLGAEVLILLGVLEEVDELHDFDLRLFAASNISERSMVFSVVSERSVVTV